jgi:K+-sensing histidine kinase KdpD
MVKVLDEVIKVSKIEQGTIRLETRSLPLTKVFEDVHLLTHMQAANRNLQLEVISPDSEIYVLADPQRFQQVLLGLVDSAIAHMEDGSIRVSAASVPESQEVRIWIDVQSPNLIWSEPVDLLSTTPEREKQPGETEKISPGLNFFMVQTLVEGMQGRLEVLPVSGEDPASGSPVENLTRLQCTMPLVTPGSVEQALGQD